MMTLGEVREAIRQHLISLHPQNLPLDLSQWEWRDETFEEVLTGDGEEKYLIPTTGFSLHHLYRGQNKEFIPCRPSLYRGNPDELDVFIERLRLTEFKHLISEHPIVEGFFKPSHFKVDIEGLAQHYGLRTRVLDLTSSLDVALFFAVCEYDRRTDSYKYYDDCREHNAVLYIFRPLYDNKRCPGTLPNSYLNHNITPIGLQAFPRPGRQHAFSLHLGKDTGIRAYKYKFSFSCVESKELYDRVMVDRQIFDVEDILVRKTKQIAKRTAFSPKVFEAAFEEYWTGRESKSELIKELSERRIGIYQFVKGASFSSKEKQEIIDAWNSGTGERMCKSIVRRKCFVPEVDEAGNTIPGRGEWYPCMSLEKLIHLQTLSLVQNPEEPKGAEWVNL